MVAECEGLKLSGESLAILVVILVLQMMLLRAGRREQAILVLPLLSVPFFYLSATVGGTLLEALPAEILYPGMVVAGMLVGVGGCLALSYFIRHRGVKMVYISLGCVFTIAVAISFLMHLP